jgi:hypothetical protein
MMAKFSQKMMGKEVGQAPVYAQPHTMQGETNVSLGNNGYPNNIPNTQTERTRGTRAQTKGFGHSKKMG